MKCTIFSDQELIEQWLAVRIFQPGTCETYQSAVNKFLRHAQKPLKEVTLQDLTRYLRHIVGEHKPGTVAKDIGCLRSLFAFGVTVGYLEHNLALQLTKPKLKNQLAERILYEEDIDRLVAAAATPRDGILIRLCYLTGARISEVVSLCWRDLTPREEGGQAAIYGKNGRTRHVLIGEPLWGDLWARRARSTDPVFPSRQGSLKRCQAWRIIKAAAQKAGLPQATSPHWLRHAHASHALENGAPLPVLQATLGHESLSATARYLHARPNTSSSSYLKKK